MFDPTNIPDIMTNAQIEWFVLFGICVAGKSAKQTEIKLNGIIAESKDVLGARGIFLGRGYSPFYVIRQMAVDRLLMPMLKKHKIGQYARIEQAMRYAVSNLDVAQMTLEDLEAIPGIGPKTARMVILYAQPDMKVVPLDTHILKFLASLGIPKVPKSTPPAGLKYALLESLFVEEAHRRGKTVKQLDTEVWKSYQSKTAGAAR